MKVLLPNVKYCKQRTASHNFPCASKITRSIQDTVTVAIDDSVDMISVITMEMNIHFTIIGFSIQNKMKYFKIIYLVI